MTSFIRAAAPAVAIGGAAVAVVALFDPALVGVGATPVTVGTESSAAGQQPGDDPASAPAQPRRQQGQAAPAEPEAQSTRPPQDSGGTDAAATCADAPMVEGPAIGTRWGPVQVAARIADGKVCDVQALVWPDGDPRSAQINAYAIPELDAMAARQGTEFDAISGATYTSEAYRDSLQALLDAAG